MEQRALTAAWLEHSFADETLLVRALTHSSLAFEHAAEGARDNLTVAGEADNEQLEFLGDAVIGLLVADWLYGHFPELKEGELSRLRAHLVSRKHLGEVAVSLELGRAMRLGRGEERSGGRHKAALQANCIEAVIGALYLDGGLDAARRFVEKHVVAPFAPQLRSKLGKDGNIGDHKTALQEYLQAMKNGAPQYVVKAESGPDHRKRFLVEVRLAPADSQPRTLARGMGSTKKKAEQEAARRAYERLMRAKDSAAMPALLPPPAPTDQDDQAVFDQDDQAVFDQDDQAIVVQVQTATLNHATLNQATREHETRDHETRDHTLTKHAVADQALPDPPLPNQVLQP